MAADPSWGWQPGRMVRLSGLYPWIEIESCATKSPADGSMKATNSESIQGSPPMIPSSRWMKATVCPGWTVRKSLEKGRTAMTGSNDFR